MEIPLFPLHAVLAPGTSLPLHVFEPRYRTLLADCLATSTPFGVVCLSAGQETGHGSVAFARVGTLAEIRVVARHPDGRADILAVGTRRFRLTGVVADQKPYLVGTGDVLDEPLGDPAIAAALADRVGKELGRYLRLLESHDTTRGEPAADGPPPPIDEERRLWQEIAESIAARSDPTALAHAVAGLVRVAPGQRQRLLEAATTVARLELLEALLVRESALLARHLVPFAADPRSLPLRRN